MIPFSIHLAEIFCVYEPILLANGYYFQVCFLFVFHALLSAKYESYD